MPILTSVPKIEDKRKEKKRKEKKRKKNKV